MTLTAMICAAALSAPVLPDSALAEAARKVDFPVFRPNSIPLGYSLIRASVSSGTTGKVVRLTYLNKESKNAFDLVQGRAGSGTPDSGARQLLRQAGLEIDSDTTFVSVRRSQTDVAFLGTLISLPSARTLVQGLTVIRVN